MTDYPKTRSYMKSAIKLGISSLEQFNPTQQQEIIYEFYSEANEFDKYTTLNASMFNNDSILCKLLRIESVSDFERHEVSLYFINHFWKNIDDILEDIFDEASLEVFQEQNSSPENPIKQGFHLKNYMQQIHNIHMNYS